MIALLATVLSHFVAMFYFVPFVFKYTNGLSIAESPDYITNSIPFFIILAYLEYSYGKWRKFPLYSLKDTIMSLSLGTVQQLLGLWMKEVTYIPYIIVYQYFSPHRAQLWKKLFGVEQRCSDDLVSRDHCSESDYYQTQLLYFFLGFIGVDISYYFMHRFAHEMHMFWFSHAVHHSGERYNLATALRQGSLQGAYSWMFQIPWAMVGLPPVHYLRHSRLNTIYQFWIHTEAIGRLPWLFELIFNTPSHHRPHHRPPGNCNYGGVLIVWDRIFGTFVAESDIGQDRLTSDLDDYKRGIIYGLSKPLVSYDPIKANIQHLLNLSYARTNSPNPSLWERWASLLSLILRKRVSHPLIIETDVNKLIPDILYDWKLEENLSTVEKLLLYWNRIWRLPPPVPDVSELETLKQVETQGSSAGTPASPWTMRDLVFIEGREQRNLPVLSWGSSLLVALHFLVALVVSYAFLLLNQLPLFQNGTLGRMYSSLYTLGCLLLLQTVQFHYFPGPKARAKSD